MSSPLSNWHWLSRHTYPMADFPQVKTTTFIGIMVAIAGNVLISLALNLQKLAHKRVEMDKLAQARERSLEDRDRTRGNGNASANGSARHADGHDPSLDEADEILESAREGEHDGPVTEEPRDAELQPLLLLREQQRTFDSTGYGTASPDPGSIKREPPKRTLVSRLFPFQGQVSSKDIDVGEETTMLPVDVITEEARRVRDGKPSPPPSSSNSSSEEEVGNESDYLKSKLWWSGFLLMNIGELGNFISYAFAPASVVAPLGTFALIANCIFAPLLLKERFRKLDLLGISLAIIGALTVVTATNASDIPLDPSAFLHAISQAPFIVYSCVYTVGAVILALLSRGRVGKQWVFVDVGVCALFGGFTVLSTKAISTLLTMEWLEMFTEWITYPTIFVLVFTGIAQIRYLNRALMRFDSKVVIPIQFVLFNLSAITGSAILYGDFQKATYHQMVTFLYGCAATFGGVFVIAWAPTGDVAWASAGDTEGDIGDGEAREGGEGAIAGEGTGGEGSGTGTIGRRRPGRATLVLPTGVGVGVRAAPGPILGKRQSAVSLIGISPAQHLLLVHTPPRDTPFRDRDRLGDWDVERNGRGGTDPVSTPPDYQQQRQRRRAISWLGDGDGGRSSSTTGGRTRNRDGPGSDIDGGSSLSRVGSLTETEGGTR